MPFGLHRQELSVMAITRRTGRYAKTISNTSRAAWSYPVTKEAGRPPQQTALYLDYLCERVLAARAIGYINPVELEKKAGQLKRPSEEPAAGRSATFQAEAILKK